MVRLSFVNDARVMSKRQVTISKNLRNALGIDVGDGAPFLLTGIRFGLLIPLFTH